MRLPCGDKVGNHVVNGLIPVIGILGYHLHDDIVKHRALRNSLGWLDRLLVEDLIAHVGNAVAEERARSRNQFIEQDTQLVDVRPLCGHSVFLGRDLLRRGVVQREAHGCRLVGVAVADDLAQSPVGNLGRVIFGYEDVLRLYVAVDDLARMCVGKPARYAQYYLVRIRRRQRFFHIRECPRDILHLHKRNREDVYGVESDDVGMLETVPDLHLLHEHPARRLIEVYRHFYGDNRIVRAALCLEYSCNTAFSDELHIVIALIQDFGEVGRTEARRHYVVFVDEKDGFIVGMRTGSRVYTARNILCQTVSR